MMRAIVILWCGLVLVFLVIAYVGLARQCANRPATPPPSWHGINPDMSTCQPDEHDWPWTNHTTCISGGTFYTCLLNSKDWVYECAPGISPMEKP